MVKSQENGITILLGLKGHEVGKVSENEDGIMVEVRVGFGGINCPRCGSMRLYRHGWCQRRELAVGYDTLHRSYLSKFYRVGGSEASKKRLKSPKFEAKKSTFQN